MSTFSLYDVEIYDFDFPFCCYEEKFDSLSSAKNAIKSFLSNCDKIDLLSFWITVYIYDIDNFQCVDFYRISINSFANKYYRRYKK